VVAHDESAIVTKPSPRSVADTVSRLIEMLDARGIKLFAVIDQSAEAREAGLQLRETVLVIFGDPAAGTPVMVDSPLAALDLPLKVLIWCDEGLLHGAECTRCPAPPRCRPRCKARRHRHDHRRPRCPVMGAGATLERMRRDHVTTQAASGSRATSLRNAVAIRPALSRPDAAHVGDARFPNGAHSSRLFVCDGRAPNADLVAPCAPPSGGRPAQAQAVPRPSGLCPYPGNDGRPERLRLERRFPCELALLPVL
jgi:hypothetical protein